MPIKRKKTRKIHIGDVPVGGDSPVAVQSMTNTDTRDVSSTVKQIKQLSDAGCDIVRLAVLDRESAEAFRDIKSKVDRPLIADIHFDHRLALAALKAGADGLRINPGNIGGRKAVEKILKEAAIRDAPIRVGVNAGSLSKEILKKYGHPTPEAMVESALEYIGMFETLGFEQMKISLKKLWQESKVNYGKGLPKIKPRHAVHSIELKNHWKILFLAMPMTCLKIKQKKESHVYDLIIMTDDET